MISVVLHLLLAQEPSGSADQELFGDPPVPAPFEKLDTLCVDDWWNRPPSAIVETRVPRDEVIAFGIYTLAGTSLGLTAQLFPLYPDETRTVRLEVRADAEGEWVQIARREVDDIGWATTFRIDDWDPTEGHHYRLLHGESASFEGWIRPAPSVDQELVLGALSCNSNQDRGTRDGIVANLRRQDPDLVFFAGDQSYDHRQHTAAWLAFGLQFRELFRGRPCITIPDDHDIGQGNVWGESGKVAELAGGADGGYFHHPEYVRMVERAQTAHLPRPVDPEPVERGIGVYFTRLRWGPVDFAIVEDRKFKSGPAGKIPQQGPRPDHIRDPNYDPASVDVEGLSLLGERQLVFLDSWGQEPAPFKAVLSQTGFCGGAHLHGSVENRLHADLDSNGWPQTGRNRALAAIRKAGAVHVAGDQHLATVIQHGVETYRDGPWAFVVPAICNDYYSRWWWPEDEAAGSGTRPEAPLPWTGDYLDGFGNRITMHAYANPESASAGAGYGLIRFAPTSGLVTFECWPRDVDVSDPKAEQFPGWPITVDPRQ